MIAVRLAGIRAGVLYGSRMADHQLTCRRTGCNRPAAASLSFRYETRQVWVVAPPAGETGTRYDLCAQHADGLTVPRGWHRVEQRQESRRVAEAAVRTGEPAQASEATPAPRKRRASPDPVPAVEPQPAAGRKRSAPRRGAGATALSAQPTDEGAPAPQPVQAAAKRDRYARLLSDLPRLAVPQGGKGAVGRDEDGMAQLAIGVPDPREAGAVVVSLTELAGARRDREGAPS